MNSKQVNAAREKRLKSAADETFGCLTVPIQESQVVLSCFQNPWQALQIAWLWQQDTQDDRLNDLRRVFPGALQSICVIQGKPRPTRSRFGPTERPTNPRPSETADVPDLAFDYYLGHLAGLLSMWHKPGISSEIPEPADWYFSHPDVFAKVQSAVRLRSTQLRLQEPNFLPNPMACKVYGDKSSILSGPKLVKVTRFIMQLNWKVAAETVAYAVFGDFLEEFALKSRFCRNCGRLFGNKKTGAIYCSMSCSHAGSSNAHNNVVRNGDRCRLYQEIKKVVERLRDSRRQHGFDIRAELEGANPAPTSTGRRSRRVGNIIKAAHAGKGSPGRYNLLRSLVPPSSVRIEGIPGAELGRLNQDLSFDETLDWIQIHIPESRVREQA